MLVLARKKNQSIIINDDIEIFVVDINNDQIKLGIKAPKNVTVHRKEVYDSIKKQMIAAADSSIKNIKEVDLLKKKKKKNK
ncbi:MAG TPA: carbon storage regulator CsrA [Spirochaetota bacterium]|nr:carbon storage regulator CsrA [Spirochaetota bacterium]